MAPPMPTVEGGTNIIAGGDGLGKGKGGKGGKKTGGNNAAPSKIPKVKTAIQEAKVVA